MDWLAAEMLTHDVKPEIEAFDLSHIFRTAEMVTAGQIRDQPYVQFVMGVKNAMPADRRVFDFYVETVDRLFPGAPWCAAGIGRNQIVLNEWAVAAGGHARTGLEDNVRLDRDVLAPSNAALVARTAEICARHDRPVADAATARRILGLPRALSWRPRGEVGGQALALDPVPGPLFRSAPTCAHGRPRAIGRAGFGRPGTGARPRRFPDHPGWPRHLRFDTNQFVGTTRSARRLGGFGTADRCGRTR